MSEIPGARAVRTAHSTHPVSAVAVGEIAGQILETIGGQPDLVVVLVTAGHAGALEDIGSAIETLLAPRVLLGASASGVIAGPIEVESGPGVALLAASGGAVRPLRIPPQQVCQPPARAILLGARRGIPDAWTSTSHRQDNDRDKGEATVVAGGVVSGPLLLDGTIYDDGVVGVTFDKDFSPGGFRALSADGCVPFGPPLRVTAAEDNRLVELDGRPALSQLRRVASDFVASEDLKLVETQLHIAFQPAGTYRRVARVEHSGAMVLRATGRVEEGTSVSFAYGDPLTATNNLEALGLDESCRAALAFVSAGRGRRFFGTHHHDALTLSEGLTADTVGCFTDLEFTTSLECLRATSQSAALALFGTT